MAKVCHSCGKKPAVGNSRSHSMVATRRRFNPNLQKVRIDDGGRPRRVYVCTRCLKSNKVTKARCSSSEPAPASRADATYAARGRRSFRRSLPPHRRRLPTHLEARRNEINDLNVFPVADGDTGDNMALTMRAVLDELDRLEREGDGDPATAPRSSTPSPARR